MPRRSVGGYLRRHWLAIVLAVFVLFSEALILTQFPVDRTNVGEASQDAGHSQDASRQIPPLAFAWVPIRARLLSFVRINLLFIDKYHDTLNAVSTLAVAIFTATLWSTTRGLYASGERQIKLLEINIETQDAVTKETLRIAGVNALAAESAAKIAQQALTSLERPFIVVEHHDFSALVDFEKESPFIFSTVWKNGGRAWTSKAVNYINWSAFDNPISNDFDFPDINYRKESLIILVIGPGSTAVGQDCRIPISNVREVMEGRRHLYVWGWCEYSGVFADGPRYRTEFCVKVQPEYVGTPGEDGRRKAFVRFPRHACHNGADEDCHNPVRTWFHPHDTPPQP